METKIEKIDTNLVKAEFEIDAKVAEDEYNKTVRMLAQRVNIPGFRKGKAPQKMIEQQLGVDYIKRTTLEHLLPQAFSKIITENNLDILTEPVIENFNFELGQPIAIEAKIELKPEVTLGKYKDLTIEIEEYKIPENAMELELDTLRKRFGSNKEVTDRKTLATDIVNIDFEGWANGELIKGGTSKGYQLDLEHSNFIEGFAEQLVDKELNSEFDIQVTFPENYHEDSLKGQPATFKIKLNKILEKELPELNDDLAKKIGLKNLDELKADIQKYLDASKKNEDDKRFSQKLFETILEDTKVDIQQSMIEREANQLREEFKTTISNQGGNWDDVVKEEGNDKIWADLKKEAESRIKNSLVIQGIQKLEKLEITSQDINAKFEEMARMYGTDVKTLVNQFKGNQQFFYSLSQQAITEKVMKFLAENNTVKVK